MKFIQEESEPLKDLTDKELAEIVKSNDVLDLEKEKIIKEKIEDNKRKKWEINSKNKAFKRLRKSPLEIINRSLFFIFLVGFIFSFISVYAISFWWFCLYVISAFSCIFYTPNRKSLKELIAAWPNIEDLLRNRSLWK